MGKAKSSIEHWLGGNGVVYIRDPVDQYTRMGVICVQAVDAAEIRRVLDGVFPTKHDDLAAANAMNEDVPFRTFSMGATVSKDDKNAAMASAIAEASAGMFRPKTDAEKLAEAEFAIEHFKRKIKRLKRALKGALK